MPLPAELIQVAGVRDADELASLCELGVPLVGFPLALGVHQPDLGARAAARLIARLPGSTRPVLITYMDRADEVVGLADELGVRIVQLHGDVSRRELRRLRARRPEFSIIRALIVRGDNGPALLELVERQEDLVDAWITDSFDARTGASGATGRTHDWGVSRQLVSAAQRPVMLAGGLNPGNVTEAIRRVCPAGVDAHTGLENEAGRKDPERVRLFLERARQALDG